MLTAIAAIIGALSKFAVGSFLRYVPELFKMFSDKADRDHEYRMTQLQLQIDQARAQQQLDLAHAQGEIAQASAEMRAMVEALKQQGQLTGVRWVDGFNALVRPMSFTWWMLLYTIYKILAVILAFMQAATLDQFMAKLWTDQDMEILLMMLGFWFVDRSLRKNSGR